MIEPTPMHLNGKSKRRIQQAAARAVQSVRTNPDRVIDINDPLTEGVEGKIDVFDVHDKRPRLMFIMERLSPEKAKEIGKDAVLHMLRWNANAIVAHSIAIDGVNATRQFELVEIAKATAQIAPPQQDSIVQSIAVDPDIIPSDFDNVDTATLQAELDRRALDYAADASEG
jgi:hypothetical protein